MTANTYTLRMQAAGAEAAGDPVMLPPQMVRALADLIDAARNVAADVDPAVTGNALRDALDALDQEAPA